MSAQTQSTFIYEITLYDQFKHRSMWGEREQEIQQKHIEYLKKLTAENKLEMASRIHVQIIT